jgi:hypothetical protein
MKKLFTAFIVLVCFNLSFSQQIAYEPVFYPLNEMFENIENEVFTQRIIDLDEFRWQLVDMSFNGKSEKQIMGRFNPITDAVEIKENDNIKVVVKRNDLRIAFTETNTTYQAKSYYGDDDKIYTTYFLVDEFSDELGLYKKQTFHSVKPNSTKYIDIRKQENEIKKGELFFIIDKNNRLLQLTTNRRVIRKSFPKNAPLIINFIKDNNLVEKEKSDIVALARFVNSLQFKNE